MKFVKAFEISKLIFYALKFQSECHDILLLGQMNFAYVAFELCKPCLCVVLITIRAKCDGKSPGSFTARVYPMVDTVVYSIYTTCTQRIS